MATFSTSVRDGDTGREIGPQLAPAHQVGLRRTGRSEVRTRMPDSSPPLILVGDADEGKRATITSALRGAGYAVTEARTGAETVRLADAGPGLVVLDIDLPDASGFEVCRQLKANPATAAIPVLQISTTFADSEQPVPSADGAAEIGRASCRGR